LLREKIRCGGVDLRARLRMGWYGTTWRVIGGAVMERDRLRVGRIKRFLEDYMLSTRTWSRCKRKEELRTAQAPQAPPLAVRAPPTKNPISRQYPGRMWKVTDSGRSDRCDKTAAGLLRARSNRHAPQRTARQEQRCICRLAREIADAKSEHEAEHAGENSRDGGLGSNGARQGWMVISAIAAVLIDGAVPVICHCIITLNLLARKAAAFQV
jgi:hypothetical protein